MARRTANRTDNSIDFGKLRKRRQRAALVRRLLILAGVALVVLGLVALNNYLVEEGFTVHLSDMVQSVGGSGYPVPLPGGVIRSVKRTGDHLAVLNDTNLYILSAKGKEVGNFQRMSTNTVLLSTPDRLLTYDEGAKRFVIHSHSRVLLEQELDYGIITAAMNNRGDYAIVSSAHQFICEINVYNKKFQHVGVFKLAENIIHTVGLSPKGNIMAAGWAGSSDGVLYSGVTIYRLDVPQEDSERATFELSEDLVLDLWFADENHIAILSDRQYAVIDTAGDLVHSYSFGERNLLASRREGSAVLLLLEDRAERRQEVVVLDGDLNERGVYTADGGVQDVALSARRVYILEDDVIYTYDHRMQPTSQNPAYPVQKATRIAYAGDRLYYLTREEICQLPRQTEEISSAQEATSSEEDEEVVG